MGPVATYACDTWILGQKDEYYFRIFERKILRKMFGPVQNNNGSRRIRRNYEINNPINGIDIVRFRPSRRIA